MDYYRRSYVLTSLIHLAVWLTEAILIIRIVLRLFSANPNVAFVHWIYETSGTLLEPFRGIFPAAVIHRGFVIDFTALFAVIIYALVGALLIWLVNLLERSIAIPAAAPKRR